MQLNLFATGFTLENKGPQGNIEGPLLIILLREEGHNIESDLATGEVRRRVVKKRPVTAAASPPSCRRAPGYKAPHEDYWEVAPGEPREDGYDSFYLRPEDYEQGTGGYD